MTSAEPLTPEPVTPELVSPHPDVNRLIGAKRLVAGARRVVVLTGAGISTGSGIPDFRGPNGVWTRNPEAEKLASIEHYLADPAIRQRSWQSRLNHGAWAAVPGPAHVALARFGSTGCLDLLVTQNVDGLHLAAGSDPTRFVEIHGTMREAVCMDCGCRGPMASTLDRVRAGELDPDCLSCGGILKSATVSFGQSLDSDALERSFAAAGDCDLMVAVGSTLAVFPIAQMVPIAASAGAPVVVVNAEPTQMDDLAAELVRGDIAEVVPLLFAQE